MVDKKREECLQCAMVLLEVCSRNYPEWNSEITARGFIVEAERRIGATKVPLPLDMTEV